MRKSDTGHTKKLELTFKLNSLLRYKKIVRLLCWPFIRLKRRAKVILYSFSADARYFRSLKDTHKGERCVIIGNGPSLKTADLDQINCMSFASNGIYQVFSQTAWRPDVYMAIDNGVLINLAAVIPTLPCKNIYLANHAKKLFPKQENIHYMCSYLPFRLNYLSPKRLCFSPDVSKYFGAFGTVTGHHIQLALYMGFSEIILLGVDNSYSVYYDERGKLVNAQVDNYFYNDSSNQYWHVPFLFQMTQGYRLCKEYADSHGVTIYNATRGGKLEVFERVDFDEIIRRPVGVFREPRAASAKEEAQL